MGKTLKESESSAVSFQAADYTTISTRFAAKKRKLR